MRVSDGYVRAETVDEAVAALQSCKDGDAFVLAGGTIIGSLINQKLLAPSLIVDISRIDELRRIKRSLGGGLLIGALATHHDVRRSAEIRSACPLMSEIADEISCDRLRNRGTVGGSLCSVGQQGDTAVGLLAAAAMIHIQGPGGSRTVAMEDFYSDTFSTVLESGELVTKVEILPLPKVAKWAFSKIGPRKAMDFTLISVAVMLTCDARRKSIDTIRLAVSGASDTATRLTATERMLVGSNPEELEWDVVEATVDKEISPQGDLVFSEDYKRHVCAVVIRRTVERAWSKVDVRGEM